MSGNWWRSVTAPQLTAQTAAIGGRVRAQRGEVADPPWMADSAERPCRHPLPARSALEFRGYDLVSGWRHQRQDCGACSRWLPIHRSPSRLIARVHGRTLHDYGCSLKAYTPRSEVTDLNLYARTAHRFCRPWLSSREPDQRGEGEPPRTAALGSSTYARSHLSVLDGPADGLVS